MALWVCGGEAGCGTKYAVGLFRCPRCHNTEFYEDGDPMAKITRHGGASDATLPAEPEPEPEGADVAPEPEAEAQPEQQGEHGPELLDLPFGTQVHPTSRDAEEEGGEESSPGSSSSASTEKPPTNSEPSSKTRPRRARKTANPSEKDQTGSDSAPSTAGEKTDGTSTPDVSE
ncbi:hypothetical protein [Streptomyces caniscabiei]|uniref:hypothetical protein n=1 Tax=Streptomyces caniscabiei TaxID=2746961 RepID=UPI000765942F|nr:hypothetical protein [Streptomyces caniscabiei]